MRDVEEKRIQIGGREVNFWESRRVGAGLVFLHGGGSDEALLSWKLALEYFQGSYHVLAPDWPGYGKSAPIPFERPIPAYADWLQQFLNCVHPKPVHLVGLSMGGAVALYFATRYPSQVQSLTLVSSYGLSPWVPGGGLAFLFTRHPAFLNFSRLLLGKYPAFLRANFHNVINTTAALTPDLLNEARQAILRHTRHDAWYQFLKKEVTLAGMRTDLRWCLPRVKVPALCVHGTRDRLVPFAHVRAALRRHPHWKLVPFPGCGHWIPREAPQRFHRTLENFLKQASGT